MNSFVASPLIAFAALLSSTYGKEPAPSTFKERPSQDAGIVDIVNVGDLSSGMLQDIICGRIQNIAVEFPKGGQLPLDLLIEGDLVSLVKVDETPLYLAFKQSVFLRNYKGSLYLSTDFQNWKPLDQFVTGKLQVGLSVDNPDGPLITLDTALYERVSPDEIVD